MPKTKAGHEKLKPWLALDLETTGLCQDPNSVLLEICAATLRDDREVTGWVKIVDWKKWVIRASYSQLRDMDQFCKNAHGDIDAILNSRFHCGTGPISETEEERRKNIRGNELTTLSYISGIDLAKVERELTNWTLQHFELGEAKLFGNSVWTDRVHLQRHMPFFESILHHRNIDVSSLWESAKERYQFKKPKPTDNHRAEDGVGNAVQLYNWIHDKFWVNDPGNIPTV